MRVLGVDLGARWAVTALLATMFDAALAAQGATWTQVASTGPAARLEYSMVYDSQRGKIVLFGGSIPLGILYLGDTWEWDGSTWAQVATAGPTPRHSYAMVYESQRQLTVLLGGQGAVNALSETLGSGTAVLSAPPPPSAPVAATPHSPCHQSPLRAPSSIPRRRLR